LLTIFFPNFLKLSSSSPVVFKTGCSDPWTDTIGSRSIPNKIQQFLHSFDRIWKARRRHMLILQTLMSIAVNFFRVLEKSNVVISFIFHGSYNISLSNLVLVLIQYSITRSHIKLRNNYSHEINIIISRRSCRQWRFLAIIGDLSIENRTANRHECLQRNNFIHHKENQCNQLDRWRQTTKQRD